MKRFWLVLGSIAALGTAYGLARGPQSPDRVQSARHISQVLTIAPLAVVVASVPGVSTTKSVSVRDCTDRLRHGRDWLRTVPDYSALFYKQEKVHGELRELETIQLKVRHAPFSVAMSWEGNGRQAYYLEGTNGNRMTVLMGGWKRRLGWINLELHSTLALQYARYPITDVGMLKLTEQLLERFEPYEQRTDGVRCGWLADAAIGGRDCQVFSAEYASPTVNPDYRRSLVWLDKEWSVPLAMENFDWDVSDTTNPDGLVERYVYEEVRLRRGLSDVDFISDAQSGSETVSEVSGSN
jgi:hypothetical protein